MIPRAGVLAGFRITLSFAGEQAVLGVSGELDMVSSPELAAMVSAVLDCGHASVVLDLAELDFMDASGLGIIAVSADRLGSFSGRLTIRSPSAMVRRMLDVTGLAEVVEVEEVERNPDALGSEQTATVPGSPVTVEPLDLVAELRRVTAVPADDDVVDGALRLVVALARATVGGADGVSVSLQRHGRLSTVAASDQTIMDMDTDQYTTGEGPCVDASVEGRWFHAESLQEETRWPAFTPKALDLGIKAILSSPLLAGDRPVGALNIYSRTTAAFATKEQELASMFATEASVILRDAGVGVADDHLLGRLGEALRTRQVIAQAQGVVMEREGVSEEEAYSLLRNFSRTTDLPIRDRAADVVGSTRRGAPWAAS
jgi:anti-anti-sigma factor